MLFLSVGQATALPRPSSLSLHFSFSPLQMPRGLFLLLLSRFDQHDCHDTCAEPYVVTHIGFQFCCWAPLLSLRARLLSIDIGHRKLVLFSLLSSTS